MIKFRHNDMMDRHEVDFETKLGNLDQVVTVAVIDKDNAITFYKTLDIEDAQEIIMEWKSTEHYLKNQVVSPSVDR